MAPKKEDFQQALDKKFLDAEKESLQSIDITSGPLHSEVGGYPGPDHNMHGCCKVMKDNMQTGDRIIKTPPSGKGATRTIMYFIPRKGIRRTVSVDCAPASVGANKSESPEHTDAIISMGESEGIMNNSLKENMDINYSIGKKTLILIPCCKEKIGTGAIKGQGQAIGNIKTLRDNLLRLIKKTPDLADRRENINGILNPDAPQIRAIERYNGNFYKFAKASINNILLGQYPSVYVLVVSAFFGLVRLDEPISNYELQMGDKLFLGMSVDKYWKQIGLWKLLKDFINEHKITHIWSLLPSPYHSVFDNFWKESQINGSRCIRVKVPGAGIGTDRKRAEWLVNILKTSPDFLCAGSLPPNHFKEIPENKFEYVIC